METKYNFWPRNSISGHFPWRCHFYGRRPENHSQKRSQSAFKVRRLLYKFKQKGFSRQGRTKWKDCRLSTKNLDWVRPFWLSVQFSFYVVKIFATFASFKGQLISKCPYKKSVSSKIPTRIFLNFCPEFFCSFLGTSWKDFGLYLGFLIYDITY